MGGNRKYSKMNMNICMYIYIYIYIQYVFIDTHTCIHIHLISYICIYMYTYVYMHVYVYIYLYIYIYTYMCVCVCEETWNRQQLSPHIYIKHLLIWSQSKYGNTWMRRCVPSSKSRDWQPHLSASFHFFSCFPRCDHHSAAAPPVCPASPPFHSQADMF